MSQAQIPGGPWLDESGQGQSQIGGGPWVDEASGAPPSDPTLSAGSFTATGTTTGTLSVTTDIAAGTLYAVLTTSSTTPSNGQIAAGQDHTGAAAAWDGSDASVTAGANTFNATGLSAGTEYWPHFFHDTGAGDTLTGSSDTTDSVLRGFDFDTDPDCIFGEIVGSLTGIALEAENEDYIVRAYDVATGALIEESGTLQINAAGRLPRWEDAAFANATTYHLVFVRVADGAIACKAMATTS